MIVSTNARWKTRNIGFMNWSWRKMADFDSKRSARNMLIRLWPPWTVEKWIGSRCYCTERKKDRERRWRIA